MSRRQKFLLLLCPYFTSRQCHMWLFPCGGTKSEMEAMTEQMGLKLRAKSSVWCQNLQAHMLPSMQSHSALPFCVVFFATVNKY